MRGLDEIRRVNQVSRPSPAGPAPSYQQPQALAPHPFDFAAMVAELTAQIARLNDNLERQRQQLDRERVLTAEEAAELLKVNSVETVYRFANAGQLACSRLGDGPRAPMRFKESDVIHFALERRYFEAVV